MGQFQTKTFKIKILRQEKKEKTEPRSSVFSKGVQVSRQPEAMVASLTGKKTGGSELGM